jgi:beta-glucosidase
MCAFIKNSALVAKKYKCMKHNKKMTVKNFNPANFGKQCMGILSFLLFIACGNQTGNDPLEKKVNDLLSKMTLEEKIGQLMQETSDGYSERRIEQIKNGGVGSILNEVDPVTIDVLQKIAIEESRLGIPIIFARDVIHGFKTIFPVPLGQAASWNPAIVEDGAQVAAIEATSVGIRWTFAPMLDIGRDQRWGRIVEGLGEDPYLASALGAAMVRGFQGEKLDAPTSMIACAKHFVGYGAAEGGRDYNTAIISNEQLRNTYLPSFKAAADAGAETFMVSFNEINGIPSSGNSYLTQQILRDEWGYNGVVVSDWNSIGEMLSHGYVKNPEEAATVALNAGVDMDMENHVFPHLINLVKNGRVKEKTIDEAVRRILRLKFKMGLFEHPYIAMTEPIFYREDYLEKAKNAAIESAVLLKNENNLLPLTNSIKSIAVIGPMADAPHDQLGTWVFDGEKSHTVTPLATLREEYGSTLKINYAPGLNFSRDKDNKQFAQAVAAANASDVVLFFAGEEAILSGEAHSRADISLPGAQKELLAEVARTGKPIVLIVMAGRTTEIYEQLPLVNAYLFSFHPGTMGGPALVDLIFGKAVPSGKLPVTYPKMVGQTPIYYNHKNTGRPPVGKLELIDDIPLEAGQVSLGNTSHYLDAGKDPLFPFGYGLSYTTFKYSDLTLSSDEIGKDDSLIASCVLTNTGTIKGAEIVQLYIRDLVGSVTRPVKELKAFDKISLDPGESRTVSFKLTSEDLKFWNNNNQQLLEAGDFMLWIGPNSVEGLEINFKLK